VSNVSWGNEFLAFSIHLTFQPVIYVTIDSFICKDAHTCFGKFCYEYISQTSCFYRNNVCAIASGEVLYKIYNVEVKLASIQ